MAKLAQAPNVGRKISGLGTGDNHWTTESIRADVESTLGLFGVERCMFASHFPIDKLVSSYAVIFDAFREITRGHSMDEGRAWQRNEWFRRFLDQRHISVTESAQRQRWSLHTRHGSRQRHIP